MRALFSVLILLVALMQSGSPALADTAVSYSGNATIGTNSKTVLEVFSVAGTTSAAAVTFKCGASFLTAQPVHKIAAGKDETAHRNFGSIKISGAANYGLTCPIGQTLYLDVGTGFPADGSVNVITRP